MHVAVPIKQSACAIRSIPTPCLYLFRSVVVMKIPHRPVRAPIAKMIFGKNGKMANKTEVIPSNNGKSLLTVHRLIYYAAFYSQVCLCFQVFKASIHLFFTYTM